jgi:TonB family protein
MRSLRLHSLLLVAAACGAVVPIAALAAPASSPAPAASAPAAAAPARPSASEPSIEVPGPPGDYLRRMHDRLHRHWADDFMRTVSATRPPTHPFNNTSREMTVAITIRWDGTVADLKVEAPSGSPEFDKVAMDVVRKAAPFPLATGEVMSDDGYVHVSWTLARDARGCSAGPKLIRSEDPLDVALPRLLEQRRVGEALRRVGDAVRQGDEAQLDRFARLYLAGNLADPVLDTLAAAALVQAGDRRQLVRLERGLGSATTAPAAALALHRAGVDVCASLRQALERGETTARSTAIAALRAVAGAGGSIEACAPALATTAADGQQPAPVRLAALETLLAHAPATGRAVVAAAVTDAEPAVRAAAVAASVKKGAGRPEIYRLAPWMHDKAPEVRAAADAGIVRAAGDLAVSQLYLVPREKDPRPGVAVAAELAQLSSAPSAELLEKLLKREGPVQIAAARALAERRDRHAKAVLAPLLEGVRADPAGAPLELRVLAGVAKAPPVPAPAVAAIEPCRELLRSSRSGEAAGWLVERFGALAPRDVVEVLGAWLARPAPAATGQARPAPSPESAAPSAGEGGAAVPAASISELAL